MGEFRQCTLCHAHSLSVLRYSLAPSVWRCCFSTRNGTCIFFNEMLGSWMRRLRWSMPGWFKLFVMSWLCAILVLPFPVNCFCYVLLMLLFVSTSLCHLVPPFFNFPVEATAIWFRSRATINSTYRFCFRTVFVSAVTAGSSNICMPLTA